VFLPSVMYSGEWGSRGVTVLYHCNWDYRYTTVIWRHLSLYHCFLQYFP